MTKKKNGFWTFVFSLLPGAGEMYMGFFKQGISLMSCFLLIVFLASWLNIGPLLYVLPLVWFYGFFHVHNLRSLPDEEFYAVEDGYLFELDHILPEGKGLSPKWRNIFAGILIVIGVLTLGNRLLDMMYWLIPSYLKEWYWHFWHTVPQLIFAVLLIMLGIWMIRGKKQEYEEEEKNENGGGQL